MKYKSYSNGQVGKKHIYPSREKIKQRDRRCFSILQLMMLQSRRSSPADIGPAHLPVLTSFHLLYISWYSCFLLCFSYIILWQELQHPMSLKILFQVFEIDVISAWTVVWHVVSIQVLVYSGDQIMSGDSVPFLSPSNLQGLCLSLIKPQTINSPYSLSISAPSQHPLSPATLEFLSAQMVQQVINVPEMGGVDFGLPDNCTYVLISACFTQRRAALPLFSFQVIVKTVFQY